MSSEPKVAEVYSTDGIAVGAVDFMTCDTVNHNGPKTLGIFARVYYPIEADPNDHSTIPSVPDHEEEYTDGMSNIFLPVTPIIGRLVKRYFKGKLQSWNKAVRWPVNMDKAALLLPAEDGCKRPVVIVNPGYTGCRWGANGICCAMVAMGCVVLVIEPGNGSAAWTWRQTEQSIPLIYRFIGRNQGEQAFNDAYWQLLRGRSKELLQAVEFLQELDEGAVDTGKLHVGGHFDWSQFRGQLAVDNIAAVGHSQGVPVVLDAIINAECSVRTKDKIKCAIELDGSFKWHERADMQPIWAMRTPVFHLMAVKPIVPKNFEMHTYAMKQNASKTQMAVLQGATHTTWCDSRMLPKWAGGSKIDFVLAEKLTAQLIMQLMHAVKIAGDDFTMVEFPSKEFMQEYKHVLFIPITDEIERKMDKNFVPFAE